MKKKILHFFSIFSLIFVLYVSYEVTTISSKIVNRPLVVISISNVRNPQIKKLLRSFDNLYVSILLKFHNKSKLYFENKDKRDELPEKKLIKKTNEYSKNLYPKYNNGENWHRNYGNSASNRFSSLKQIQKDNVNKLGLAWKYKIKGDVFNDIQSNVIVAEKKRDCLLCGSIFIIFFISLIKPMSNILSASSNIKYFTSFSVTYP